MVVLVCELTAETRGLVGKGCIEAMKPGALLVNVARGGLVQVNSLQVQPSVF